MDGTDLGSCSVAVFVIIGVGLSSSATTEYYSELGLQEVTSNYKRWTELN